MIAQGSKGFQFVHLVSPTDIFYPNLWTNLDVGLGAAWIPSYWVRSRFEPADAVAATFRFGLMVGASNLEEACFAWFGLIACCCAERQPCTSVHGVSCI